MAVNVNIVPTFSNQVGQATAEKIENVSASVGHKGKCQCYRCDKLYRKKDMKLFGILCKSCFAEAKKIIESSTKLEFVTKEIKFCRLYVDKDDTLYTIYIPNYIPNGISESRMIARYFQRNLIPINLWEIVSQNGTSYLLAVGNFEDDTVPGIMETIAPQVTIDSLRKVSDVQNKEQRDFGRSVSTYLLGNPCGNKLEFSSSDLTDIIYFVIQMKIKGLNESEIINYVFENLHFSDSFSRKYAIIADYCRWTLNSDISKIENLVTQGNIPAEGE